MAAAAGVETKIGNKTTKNPLHLVESRLLGAAVVMLAAKKSRKHNDACSRGGPVGFIASLSPQKAGL